MDDLDVGNVTDTGNVTDLATLPRKARSMTFSPMMSAAVSDQGTGPSQPEPESAPSHAGYGTEPGQDETGPQDAQDVAWPHQSLSLIHI